MKLARIASRLSFVPLVAGCASDPQASQISYLQSASLQIYFPTMYSAFDGVHTFQLPATVTGVTGVKWSASDPSMVDITPNSNGTDAMLTMKKAGTVTITAEAGSLRGQANLTISSFTAADWEDGRDRYNNGIVFQRPTPGGPRVEQSRTLACTNCHGKAGSTGDVEHTPTQIGGYSDGDLVTIFTQGRKPAGAQQRIMPLEMWSRIHQWQMTDNERKGVIVYLRSLTPKSQGTVDFGGRGPRPDGGPPGPPPGVDGGF